MHQSGVFRASPVASSAVYALCTRCVRAVCAMCTRCVRAVYALCTRCVRALCTRYVRAVYALCARCVRTVCALCHRIKRHETAIILNMPIDNAASCCWHHSNLAIISYREKCLPLEVGSES